MVRLDTKRVMIIGGLLSKIHSASTLIYDEIEKSMRNGPEMINPGYNLGCTVFKSEAHGGRPVVLVVGGHERKNKAEVWDFTSASGHWKSIQNLPKDVAGSILVPSPTGKGVFMFHDRDIFGLNCNRQKCEWLAYQKKLEVSRSYGVAMYLPESLTKCYDF